MRVDYQFFGPVKGELELAGGLVWDIKYDEQVTICCLLPVDVDISPVLEGVTSEQVELKEGKRVAIFKYMAIVLLSVDR